MSNESQKLKNEVLERLLQYKEAQVHALEFQKQVGGWVGGYVLKRWGGGPACSEECAVPDAEPLALYDTPGFCMCTPPLPACPPACLPVCRWTHPRALSSPLKWWT